MIAEQNMPITIAKLNRLVRMLYERIFVPVGKAEGLRMYQTEKPLHQIPEESLFYPIPADRQWGAPDTYGWFRASYTVPRELDGKALFVYNKIGCYEGTLWVNGCIHSNFTSKHSEESHGNHYCNRITAAAKAGETIELAMEGYAFHHMPGTQPFENESISCFSYPIDSLEMCIRDDELFDFCMDLKTVLSLQAAQPEESFRRAELDNALREVHKVICYDLYSNSEEQFRQGMAKASGFLKAELAKKNSGSVPWVGLIGHSHMDTAWLWPIRETEKKCARSYANQLNLMEEYPEYLFVQSSACHSDMLRRNNPELFSRIQKAVKEGRYEPNGGAWVECDCNLTGGEYLVRQFVWGQRFNRKYFDYRSDSFWLPDTFGYSMAIPQIMKGCGIDYFQTTKLAWADTNPFPYTSFYWEGLDGTRVLAHLNRTHIGPTPENFRQITDEIEEKQVSSMRLLSYGWGDGGGGPEFEMLEMARRLQDVEGLPRSGYQTVSQFMHQLEDTIHEPSVYADELYLERHRGTLTNHSEIKKNNRDAEIAVHNVELAEVDQAVRTDRVADNAQINPLVGEVLLRQFHDILPGTCIHPVNEETHRMMKQTISQARQMTGDRLQGDEGWTLYNPVSFDRKDTLHVSADFAGVKGCCAQAYTDLFGEKKLAISGVKLNALSAVALEGCDAENPGVSAFHMDGDCLTTPFAKIRFDENGGICSMVDTRNGRELVAGLPFNTFVMAEDVPLGWDNWDLDADMDLKYQTVGKLQERKIISDGAVELRIRSRYAISDKSYIDQDMVFDAASPMIAFETIIDWQEEHRFLKTAFDTSLHADGVRNEIQFGYIRRSNHRSSSTEKARFEVCNHKYSDMSENSFGITLLNDCKYGISECDGSMRLSLHKGGMRPDPDGDKGRHYCRYALVIHDSPFGAESVVQPAYAFNYQPVSVPAGRSSQSLLRVDAPNVIVETVKPCEDCQKAYIVRLYEAVGDYARTALHFGHDVRAVYDCNMLEEENGTADVSCLTFRPFEIKTIKVCY